MSPHTKSQQKKSMLNILWISLMYFLSTACLEGSVWGPREPTKQTDTQHCFITFVIFPNFMRLVYKNVFKLLTCFRCYTLEHYFYPPK